MAKGKNTLASKVTVNVSGQKRYSITVPTRIKPAQMAKPKPIRGQLIDFFQVIKLRNVLPWINLTVSQIPKKKKRKPTLSTKKYGMYPNWLGSKINWVISVRFRPWRTASMINKKAVAKPPMINQINNIEKVPAI